MRRSLHRALRQARRGFTLLEVLVAMGVLVLIGGMSWEIMASGLMMRDFMEQEDEVERFCKHPFLDVGVLWNGDVTMCCMDYDAQLTVGNVNDTTLEAVMTSDAAADLRESMYSLHTLPEFCRQCQARPVLPGEDVSDAGPASSDQRAH